MLQGRLTALSNVLLLLTIGLVSSRPFILHNQTLFHTISFVEEKYFLSGKVYVGNGSFPLLELNCSKLIIEDTYFAHGSSLRGYGGCIIVRKATEVVLRNVTFFDCHTTIAGGGFALFPANSLKFSMQNVTFQHVSAIVANNGLSNAYEEHSGIAAGSAVFIEFARDEYGSFLDFNNVTVDGFYHFLENISATKLSKVSGGAIVVAWSGENSGHNVRLSASLLAFRNGSVQGSPCCVTSAFLILFFGGASSGNNGTITYGDISVGSVVLQGGPKNGNCGFGTFFSGNYSGSHLRLRVTGRLTVTDSMFSQAVAFGSAWASENSGNDVTIQAVSSSFSAVGSSFINDSAFLRMEWFGSGSGHLASFSSEEQTTWLSQDSHFESNASFVNFVFEGTNSGGNFQFSATGSSVWLSNQTTYIDNSIFLGFWFYRENSGAKLNISIAERASLIAQDSFFLNSSAFLDSVWIESSSGSDVSLSSDDFASWRSENSTFKKDSVFVGFLWVKSFSGNNFVLKDSSSWISEKSNFITFSGFCWIMWWGENAGHNFSAVISDHASWESIQSEYRQNSSFFWVNWRQLQLDQEIQLTFKEGCSWASTASYFETSSFFASIFWEEKHSNAKITMFSGENVSWRSVSSRYADDSFWLQIADYSSARVVFNQSSLYFKDNHVSSSYLILFYQGHIPSEEGNTLLFNDTSIVVEGLRGTDESIFLVLSPTKSSLTVIFMSLLSLTNVSMWAFLQIHSKFALQQVTVAFEGHIESNSSSIEEGIVQLVSADFVENRVWMSRLQVVSSTIVAAQVFQFGAEQVSEILADDDDRTSGGQTMSIDAKLGPLNAYRTSWIGFKLVTLSTSKALLVKIQITEQFIVSSINYKPLNLLAPMTKSIVQARIENVTVERGALQLVSADGLAGSITLLSVRLKEGCTVSTSLWSISLYDEFERRNLSLRVEHLRGEVSVSSDSSLFVLEGSVITHLGSDVIVTVPWYNASGEAIVLRQSADYPSLRCGESPCGYQFSLLRTVSGVGRESVKIVYAEKAGGFLEDNVFVGNVTISPQESAYTVDFVHPSGLSCPAGYAFSYVAGVSEEFYLPYAGHGYDCLDPFATRKMPSCNRPFLKPLSAECIPCPVEQISFHRGTAANVSVRFKADLYYSAVTPQSLSHCSDCPGSFICDGGPADLKVRSGFWTLPLPSLWRAVDWENKTLEDLVILCPVGACETDAPLTYGGGVVVEGTLCAGRRDGSSALCSRCQENASANFFASHCVDNCVWNAGNISLVAAISSLVVMYAVYLNMVHVEPRSPWLRVLTNYFSAVSLLYLSTGRSLSTIALQLVEGTQSTHGTSVIDSFCIPGCQPIYLKFVDLVAAVSLLVTFLAIYSIIHLRQRLQSNNSVTQKKTKWKGQLVASLFSTVLIFYSSIAGTTFTMLKCLPVPVLVLNETSQTSTIAMKSRLFDHAEWDCLTQSGGTAFLLVVGLFFVFGLPVGLFVWQGLFPSDERILYRWRSRCKTLRKVKRTINLQGESAISKGQQVQSKRLTRGTQHKTQWFGVKTLDLLEGELRAWYWDVFLFLRRTALQLVNAFAPTGIYQQTFFLILNFTFAVLHVNQNPYKSKTANVVEAYSLVFVSLVSALNLPYVLLQDASLNVGTTLDIYRNYVDHAQFGLTASGLLIVVTALLSVYTKKTYIKIRRRQKRTQKQKKDLRRRKTTLEGINLEELQPRQYFSSDETDKRTA